MGDIYCKVGVILFGFCVVVGVVVGVVGVILVLFCVCWLLGVGFWLLGFGGGVNLVEVLGKDKEFGVVKVLVWVVFDGCVWIFFILVIGNGCISMWLWVVE